MARVDTTADQAFKFSEINLSIVNTKMFTPDHCRPVKRTVSTDKGMILNAILAI